MLDSSLPISDQEITPVQAATSIAAPVFRKIKIVKPSRQRQLKAIIYGPYGIGKTRFVCSANDDPRTSPALLLNFEGGESSVAGTGIDMVRISSWDEYNEVFEYLVKGGHGYRSVLIDSITETHIFALFSILDDEGSKRRNPDLIELGDYGTASVQLRRLIRNFRDLDLHLLITALDKEETDAREGIVKKIALSGRLSDELPGIVDVVGYMTMAQTEDKIQHRAILLQNYAKFRTKIRIPPDVTAPDEIIDPDVTKLLDILKYE